MSGWDGKLVRPASPRVSLYEQVHALFEQQRGTWEMFRDGEAALAGMKTRSYTLDGARVVVQANPGRRISTAARVDPASVASRPCFLCPANLPPLERGIAFGDYILLPNPYPIQKHHMTIAHKNHEPQGIENRLGDLFSLAEALGPDMFVIYNGPRCGASAPDHMHFQACDCAGVPIFEQIPADEKNCGRVAALSIGGRNLLAGSFRRAGDAAYRIRSMITALKDIAAGDGEPMVNIIARYRGGGWIVCVFPRAKHRSACYYAPPEQRILISPAAMEMAGIVVVADPDHFDRVDENALASMFREVTLGGDAFSRLAEAVI